MRKLSIRQRNLGKPINCTPSEWAHGVFKTFDAQLPGWRNRFDSAALELALVDLMGGDKPNQLDPVRLDAMSELMAAVRGGDPYATDALKEAVATAVAHPSLPDVLQSVAILFVPGQPLKDSDLRSRRAQVLRDFLEIVEPIARLVLLRYADKLDYEEKRQAKRYPLMTQPDLAEAQANEVTREESSEPRRKATRVLQEMERTLNPRALKALRTFLAAGGTRTMTEVAGAEGVPDATMSRAVTALGAASKKVLEEADRDERLAFVEALSKTA